MVRFGERPVVPKYKPDAVLNQDNPVSGTKYTVLDTIKNVKIYGISIWCTWTVQPDPLEVWITIDGQSIRGYKSNPTSGVVYRFGEVADGADMALQTVAEFTVFHPILEGRSIKIEAEITGGTVSNISARVKHAQY